MLDEIIVQTEEQDASDEEFHAVLTDEYASTLDAKAFLRSISRERKTIWDAHMPGFGLRLSAGGSKSWIVCYRVHGKKGKVLETIGDVRKRFKAVDARKIAATKLRAAEAGDDPRAAKKAARRADISVNEFAEKCFAAIEANLKPRTVASYRQLFKVHISPTFGNMRLGDVDRAQIKDLLAQKRMASLSKNTVRLIRATISVMLAEAMDADIISTNPAALTRRRGQKRAGSITTADRKESMRPFSEIELSALLDACRDHHYFPLFLLLARTGMRPGEAFALKWTDLDFNKREILIERALSGGQVLSTKTGETRRVHMSQELAATLQQLYVSREKETLVNGWREMPELAFINGEGNALDESRVRKQFARAMKAAGLSGHRVYDLRHTFATLLLTKNAPITYVAAQLGHAKPSTTLTWYAHWLPNNDKSYADSLDTHCSAKVA
jgi:integrase